MISKSFVSEKDLQEKHRIQAEEGVTDIATLSETDRKPLWQRLEEQRQREKDERLQRYSLLRLFFAAKNATFFTCVFLAQLSAQTPWRKPPF